VILRSFFILLLIAAAFSTASAQNNLVVLEKVNTNEMTGSFVTALYTDFKGYLWVGSANGLNRYDGYSFLTYRHLKNDTLSLSHPSIKTIKQFSESELLIGTSNGLNAYSFLKDNFTRIKADSTLKNLKSKSYITCIDQLIDGRIIVGTQCGIMLFNQPNKTLQSFYADKTNLLEDNIIQSVLVDNKGDLWIGTKKILTDGNILFRLYKYNVKNKKLEGFILTNYGSSGHIGISQDYLGMIWVSIDDGLVSIQPNTLEKTFYRAPNGFLSSVSYHHGKDNVIYQGYWSFGVTAFDIDKKEYSIIKNEPANERSLMSNKVWALHKDENEVLWLGTDVGLQKQSKKRLMLEVIKRNSENATNTFASNQMLSIWADRKNKNKIFVGVDGEGLSVYDNITRKTENFNFGYRNKKNNIEERFIAQFAQIEDGSIFAAGQYNFVKISSKPNNTSIKHYFFQQQHHFTCLFQDYHDKNVLWLGGLGKVAKFNIQNETFVFIEKPKGKEGVMFSGISTQDGTFFTTQNGLIKINKNNAIELINISDVGNITCIEVFDESHLLLGTSFLGLIEFDTKKNNYKIIKTIKNKYFSEVKCIKKLRNSFWIGTNVGLFQYLPYSNETFEFTMLDGLPSNVIQNMDCFENYLYVATSNGVVIFNPSSNTSNFTIPKIAITSVVGIGNDLNIVSDFLNGEIELQESQNSFKINFTVLDFNLPEKNSYRYKLLPTQTSWKNNGTDHSVSFNQLNVGEYDFVIIGANNDNTWTREPITLKIKIIPPFYNSKPFYYILGILIFLIISVVVYLRFRRIKRTQVYLEKTIEERTEEIRLHEKELERTNSDLMDSITYAQKIQKAFLVGEKILSEFLPESFIYFKPKEKVSGDFFWIGKEKNKLIIVAGDCTGHGVPGALLSVIGTTLLNKIVHEEKITEPGKILTELNYLFYNQLNIDEASLRDGMDVSILKVDFEKKKILFAGARNNAAIIQNGNLIEITAQRESIGENENVTYESKSVPYDIEATYYLYSDGYKDQFGGPSFKKLASKSFKDILIKGSKIIMNGQKNYFSRFIKDWQGTHSQTDDRIIIGFKLR